MPNRPPIPQRLPDYRRAFQIMHGLLLSEDSVPHKACMFFATAGATILKNHYSLPAYPVAGAAFYFLDDPSLAILTYADLSEDYITSHDQAFHAWVRCGEWEIDFMAPLFPEALKEMGSTASIPRQMFQRRNSEVTDSLDKLTQSGKAGDFIHVPNIELTEQLLANMASKPAYSDLEDIASDWFKKTPKKMRDTTTLGDSYGKIIDVPISKTNVDGAW